MKPCKRSKINSKNSPLLAHTSPQKTPRRNLMKTPMSPKFIALSQPTKQPSNLQRNFSSFKNSNILKKDPAKIILNECDSNMQSSENIESWKKIEGKKPSRIAIHQLSNKNLTKSHVSKKQNQMKKRNSWANKVNASGPRSPKIKRMSSGNNNLSFSSTSNQQNIRENPIGRPALEAPKKSIESNESKDWINVKKSKKGKQRNKNTKIEMYYEKKVVENPVPKSPIPEAPVTLLDFMKPKKEKRKHRRKSSTKKNNLDISIEGKAPEIMVPQQKETNPWAKNERKNPWSKKTNDTTQRNFVPKVNKQCIPNFSPKMNYQQQPATNRTMKKPSKPNSNGWTHQHGHKKQPPTPKSYCNQKQLPLEQKMEKQNRQCNPPEAGISMDSIFEEEEIKTRGKNIKKNSFWSQEVSKSIDLDSVTREMSDAALAEKLFQEELFLYGLQASWTEQDIIAPALEPEETKKQKKKKSKKYRNKRKKDKEKRQKGGPRTSGTD